RGEAAAGSFSGTWKMLLLTAQTYGIGNIVHLFVADILELFAFSGEFFVNFYYLLRHGGVRLLRTPQQHKIWTRRQSFVTVGIQPKSQHYSFAPAFLLAVGHL